MQQKACTLTALALLLVVGLAGAVLPPSPTPAGIEPSAKAPSDDYPGLAGFNLSTVVRSGDPDRQQILSAAQWAASTGNWSRHFDALNDAISTAASSGPWQQHADNIERLVTLPTPTLALEQAKFIRAVGASTLGTFSRADASRGFLSWLLSRPQVLAAFNETIQPQDKAGEALLQWCNIWNDDKASADSLSNLAIACALVFDQPIRIDPEIYGGIAPAGRIEISALERFRFYRDSAKRGALRATLREMTPWQLVWVVDAPVPESELVWAQKHVNYPQRDWKNAYAHIRYRMDRATTRANIYKAYTLAEIEKEGGICGDQAYFASITAKANGVPAMIIGGEGDRGGHAWFGYLAGRDEWNLTSGRYADNYAAGTARDPQTRRLIKEHELKQLTDPARRTAPFDKSRKLVALAALLTEAGKLDLAALAYESALHAAPKNYDAWVATLDHLAATNAPTADWLRESARMRSTFREFPDLVQEIDQRELAYVTAHGDSDAARQLVHSQTARLESTDSSRTDLIMENVFREAALAEKSADPEAARRIYRDALRTKGGEVVAFKRIMQRYYDWAKAHGKGPEVTRELATDFDRQHREPADDVFALGSYRRVLRALSSMAGEQKLEPLQQSLDRREEMLSAREEKLDKLQSRGANIPRGGN